LHEAIVSEEMFDRVQAILDGIRPSIVSKIKINPLLPLKRLVRCESCETPLTGRLARGRGKRFARYWCRKQSCRAIKLSSTQLEDEFLALLERLRANQGFGKKSRAIQSGSLKGTADSFVRFAELQLMDIANAWRIADPEQRQWVQNLLFEGGLDYSPSVGIFEPL
jgi:hypothetical protein